MAGDAVFILNRPRLTKDEDYDYGYDWLCDSHGEYAVAAKATPRFNLAENTVFIFIWQWQQGLRLSKDEDYDYCYSRRRPTKDED